MQVADLPFLLGLLRRLFTRVRGLTVLLFNFLLASFLISDCLCSQFAPKAEFSRVGNLFRHALNANCESISDIYVLDYLRDSAGSVASWSSGACGRHFYSSVVRDWNCVHDRCPA